MRDRIRCRRCRQVDVVSDNDSKPTHPLVCDSCVRDAFLSRYIKKIGKPAFCDYCYSSPENAAVRCITFRKLVKVIRDGIAWAYSGSVQEVQEWIYEANEDGFSLDGILFDTHDLVVNEIGLEVAENVLHDVISTLPRQLWCSKDTQLSPGNVLAWSWRLFVEMKRLSTKRATSSLSLGLRIATPTRSRLRNLMAGGDQSSSRDQRRFPPMPTRTVELTITRRVGSRHTGCWTPSAGS